MLMAKHKSSAPHVIQTPEGEEIEMPGWFDTLLHEFNFNGIRERSTGLFLDGEGLPISGPARLARLEALKNPQNISGETPVVAPVAQIEEK
jgi:hypothetical protein